eukprot:1057408-Rhodomonas_salina.1
MGPPIGKPGCIPLGGNALKEYVSTAGEVLGWVTNLKTPKPSFQLKGHKQLQRETQSLRAARKEVYLCHDPFTVGDRKRVRTLYAKLHHDLRSTPMTRPRVMPENAPVPRPADVIADLTALISEREKRVNEEKKEKQQKTIKKAVENLKMQAAFSKPV